MGSVMVVNQEKKEDKEPDFMKYIKNMDINQVSNNYVKGNDISE